MKRPRFRVKHNKDGSTSFWYDHKGPPRHWEPLGKDEAAAIAKWERIRNTPKPTPGTVDQMLADAIEAMRGKVKPATLVNYKSYRKHLAAVLRKPPEEQTQRDILQYLRTCPRMTFRNEIGFLSLAYVNWMDEGRLDFNPCFGVRIKRKGSKRTRLLTWTEVDAIVAKADERLAVAIELACALGLRISDLCALRWRDVDDYTDTKKTGRRIAWERTDTLDAILTRARSLQARVASLYVLCDRRGRRWSTKWLRELWSRAVKAANIDDAHFHDLRAAAGTEIEKLYGRRAAKDFLGHKSELTTEGYLRDKRVNVVRPLQRKA